MDTNDGPEGRTAVLDQGAFSVAEAGGWSGLGRSLLYEAISSGELVSVKVGRRRLIPRRALQDFLAKHLQATTDS